RRLQHVFPRFPRRVDAPRNLGQAALALLDGLLGVVPLGKAKAVRQDQLYHLPVLRILDVGRHGEVLVRPRAAAGRQGDLAGATVPGSVRSGRSSAWT